ncbi:Hypothetical predicted protein [Mytilus galloprovincialis]|uniref:COR domain-containing protein n=1 Tax=Mytilus galloprovincialis TaxID=29158 RepID=A0A8B6BTS1_MYTGA|nr:Hypothetical predicted protein [Mytilus galloprovincialis]
MVPLTGAYEFICPSQSHWNLRAKSMCKQTTNYTCLFDINYQINVYRDRCYRPRILGPGYKYVFQPNLNRALCSGNRYQPFNFETVGYSDCTFKKTLCNSLGQTTYENGDTRVDRKCVCNTDRGYTFIMNSTKQCYCNPSSEDCSCYLGMNPYNETARLEDTKCYQEIKLTRGPFSVDMFNISRTIKIKEFDNYKYNINHLPTDKYRIEAAKLVLMLSLAYVLPDAINQLSEEDKIRYTNLMQTEKTEKRYFIRTMIVGKGSVGKTCLLRRLLKEDMSNVTSTDGVDIVVRRCKINIKNGKWIIGKEIDDDKASRMKRALNPNEEDKDTQDMQVDVTKKTNSSQSDEISTDKKQTTTDAKIRTNKSNDENESSSLIKHENLASDANFNHDKNKNSNEPASLEIQEDSATNTKENHDKNEYKNESTSLVMPADLMSNVFSESTDNTSSNLYTLCDLWDFAGQKEFYATHQAFLTSCAVYLVVADMKDDIRNQDLSQCSANFQDIGEYVDFWFDSIHCHRTADEPTIIGHFDPPILLVFTGKDKYDKEADFKRREKELDEQMHQVLGRQTKYHHLHNKFYLSNTNDSDEEFEKLRYAIYEAARKMGNWGNAFPLKWILLEYLIEINKNDGKNFINFTDMSNLAKHPDINIIEKEDLLLFLRFQHNVGNIIFFENIPDLIILRPQWLADAFRCLVSDRVDNRKLHHRVDWILFTREGIISESLITELFKSKVGSHFSGQKNNLHKVMERLDILVKIKDSSNYIMPSMMPSAKFEDVCTNIGILAENCRRTSWLCFKFEFLPPSFFNHLSAWFITYYTPSQMDSASGQVALYRGICMFDIDQSGCEKILVAMSTNTIALQVVSFSEQRKEFGSKCSDIYSEVKKLFEEIKTRYKVKIFFELHFKCKDGNYYKDTFRYQQLTNEQECLCVEHKKAHRLDMMYLPWIKKEIEKIPNDRAKKETRQDDLNLKIEPNKEAFDEDQAYVKNNLPVSVTLRQQLNIKKSKNENLMITSCIKTGNTLVFTDYRNKPTYYL